MGKLSVCIFCGSRTGENPAFVSTASAMGKAIGRRGYSLVYGGGRAGLMGTLADAALAAGAQVVGVIPQALIQRELAHPGLTDLLVVETMHERKRVMAEHSDLFVTLPGGIGTLEELFEVWSWRQLGYHDKPLGLVNIAGYYDALLAFLALSTKLGFVATVHSELLQVDSDPETLLERLQALASRAKLPDDYRAI